MREIKKFIIVLILIFCCNHLLSQKSLPLLLKKVETSVVMIFTYNSNGKCIGQGSGFFISNDGKIITNWHVLKGSYRSEVKISTGKFFPIVNIVAKDAYNDLVIAKVKIPHTLVKPLKLRTLFPEAGEKIFVVGNPLGFERTVSDGIVSAVRNFPGYGEVIQITAPVSPGSSGSPVFDMDGEVIGIVTMQVGKGQNLNFAIPSEKIVNLMKYEKTYFEGKKKRIIIENWRDSVGELYHKGMTYLLIEDYKKALRCFEEVLKKDPLNYRAYFQIGYCYDKLKIFDRAVSAYKKGLSIAPENENYEEVYYNLGVSYFELERYREGIEALKKVIEINPNRVDAFFNLATAYEKIDSLKMAIIYYKKVISLNPRYFEPLYNLGLIYLFDVKDYYKAKFFLERAKKIKPNDSNVFLSLGVVYENLKDYDRAINAFLKTVKLKPDNKIAYFKLGELYKKLGYMDKAIDALVSSIGIDPKFKEANFYLTGIYMDLDRYNEAKNVLKKYVSLNPIDFEAFYVLGVIYYKLKEYDLSIESCKKALALNPSYPYSYFEIGLVYASKEEYRKAVKCFKKAISLKPDYISAHYNLGVIYVVLKDKNSAMEEYNILKKLDKKTANKLYKIIYGRE